MENLAPGAVLDGRYELLSHIGRGGMGEVWKARHLHLETNVAIKFIRQRWFEDQTVAKRFVREAKSAARLRGPNVVQIFDHGRDGRFIYIVMELLVGQSLRELLQTTDGTLPLAVVQKVFNEIKAPLVLAHESGIVHRDLKPGNLFLSKHGPNWTAKVMDFGLAKPFEDESEEDLSIQTRQDSILGTPAYMSPEALNKRPVSPQMDMWALAIMAYELVCGDRPYQGTSGLNVIVQILTEPRPVPSAGYTVPDGFDAWFAQATSESEFDRFDDIESMMNALCLLLETGLPTQEIEFKKMDSDSATNLGESISNSAKATVLDNEIPTLIGSASTSDVTPIRVAEINTQLQYRMIEQLQKSQRKAMELQSKLDKQSDEDD